jgi:hypothetical protein
MHKGLSSICLKSTLLALSLLLVMGPVARLIHDFQLKNEPRMSILNGVDATRFHYALIGDSVFCSNYVTDEKDSLWKKFETVTGQPMFPGALSGSGGSDLVNSARYLSTRLPAGSKVFVDLNPLRFLLLDRNRVYNHEQEFADLQRGERWPLYRYYRYLNVNYLSYLPRFVKRNKRELDIKENFDRRWNVDGDYARRRYLAILHQEHQMPSEDDLQITDTIRGIFAGKGIDTVFVLTPLNKKMLYAYSDAAAADALYGQIVAIKRQTRDHLRQIAAPVVDVFESVPADCFADLVHTNACGDDLIARSLAAAR